MINVLKMDLYRMFKSKVTWLCILGTAIMMLFSVFMTSSDIHYYKSHPNELRQSEGKADGSQDWGIYMGSIMPSWCKGEEAPIANLIASNIQSKIILLFLVVFLVDFVNSEHKSRFLQNVTGQVPNRGVFILSKLIMTAMYSLLQLLFVCTVIGLSSKLFLGYINLYDLGKFALFIVVQFFLQISFGSLIILIVTLTRSTIASMIIGILLSSGILQVLDPLLRGILHKTKSFSVMYYTITGNIGRLNVDSNAAVYLQTFIVVAVYLILTSAISIYVIENRDVE